MGAAVADADPLGPAGFARERLSALRVAIEHGELHARQHVPQDRDVAVALDSAADERRADRPAGDLRREAPDRDPGHRRGALGGDRTAVEDCHGQAGRRHR